MRTPRTLPTHLPAALALALAAPVSAAPALHAQEVPRTEYIRQLPKGLAKPVPATEANVAIGLWGDPSDPAYRDIAPRDGIDDARGEVLLALGAKFAPMLVLNTDQPPIDPYVYLENRDVFPISLDLWLAGTEEWSASG